jgi:hypothetical protein
MIKKILLITLLFLSAIMISTKLYASEETADVYIKDDNFTWQIIQSNSTYLLKSNRILNTAESIDATVYTKNDLSYDVSDPNIEEIFIESLNTETSRFTLYSSETSISQIASYDLEFPDPFTDDMMFFKDEDSTDYNITIGDVYYDVTLVLSDTLSAYERNFILSVANNDVDELQDVINDYPTFDGTLDDLDFTFLEIQLDTNITNVDNNDLSDLPETLGTINDDENLMGDVLIESISDNQVTFRIVYETLLYELTYNFSANTDMSIFNNNYEIYYYTEDNQHFMIFNQGDTSMFFDTGNRVQTFIPYTTWNMDTNELSAINRFNVYLYMKIGSGEHLLGYFYVDEFIIDNLLSVNASFDFRYDPLIGKPTDWINYQTVLEDNQYTEANISWKLEGLVYSNIARTIGMQIPGLGLPLAVAGTGLSVYFAYESISELIDGNNLYIGSTEEIEAVNPSLTLESEINEAYQSAYEDYESLNLSTYNLYKLDFGTFEKTYNQLQIDEESIQVISFTYQTSGQVYTVDQENINTVGVVEDELDPTESQSNWWNDFVDWLKDIFGDALPGVIVVAAIILSIVFYQPISLLVKRIAFLFKHPRELFRFVLFAVGLGLAIWYLIGVI